MARPTIESAYKNGYRDGLLMCLNAVIKNDTITSARRTIGDEVKYILEKEEEAERKKVKE